VIFQLLLLLSHVGIELLGVGLDRFGLEMSLELSLPLEDRAKFCRLLVPLEKLHEREATEIVEEQAATKGPRLGKSGQTLQR
jgi:hypothetical protein